MNGTLVMALCGSWFLGIAGLYSKLLYQAVVNLISSPNKADPASRAALMVVGLIYLAAIAFTVQDCFAPSRTPGIFKIKSAGPDSKEQKWYGPVTRVHVQL